MANPKQTLLACSITTEIPPPGMFINPPTAWAGSQFKEPNKNLN